MLKEQVTCPSQVAISIFNLKVQRSVVYDTDWSLSEFTLRPAPGYIAHITRVLEDSDLWSCHLLFGGRRSLSEFTLRPTTASGDSPYNVE
jgi:hypothetical protein